MDVSYTQTVKISTGGNSMSPVDAENIRQLMAAVSTGSSSNSGAISEPFLYKEAPVLFNPSPVKQLALAKEPEPELAISSYCQTVRPTVVDKTVDYATNAYSNNYNNQSLFAPEPIENISLEQTKYELDYKTRRLDSLKPAKKTWFSKYSYRLTSNASVIRNVVVIVALATACGVLIGIAPKAPNEKVTEEVVKKEAVAPAVAPEPKEDNTKDVNEVPWTDEKPIPALSN